MIIEDEAREYARRNVGGMQPATTVGDKVRAAYIAGAASRERAGVPSVEEVAALIPAPEVSQDVRDWPPDEQEMYREGCPEHWTDFTERHEVLSAMRRWKVAERLVALCASTSDNGEAHRIKAAALREAADSGEFVGPIADMLAVRADRIEKGEIR
ncbi:hypothetical protein [Cellulosimicrobium sp. NPDC057127]|uniref:hypothetical protein n=1 Tax=Cellulosimicrobium sp. NPDC057127 TaxID=3346026 RepID=UPI00362FE010